MLASPKLEGHSAPVGGSDQEGPSGTKGKRHKPRDATLHLRLSITIAGGERDQAVRHEALDDASGFEYEPLAEYTGLFRIFADVESTEAGILEFAQQYGHLGIGGHLETPKGQLSRWELGEPLAKWLEEIFAMRDAVRVVDLLKKDDLKALSRHIVGPYVDEDGLRDCRQITDSLALPPLGPDRVVPSMKPVGLE